MLGTYANILFQIQIQISHRASNGDGVHTISILKINPYLYQLPIALRHYSVMPEIILQFEQIYVFSCHFITCCLEAKGTECLVFWLSLELLIPSYPS